MMRDAAKGIVPTLDAGDLISAMPQLANISDIEARSLRQLPGASLSLKDVLEAAESFNKRWLRSAQGRLSYRVQTRLRKLPFCWTLSSMMLRPVVVTGAVRSPQEPGADGSANILSACLVAVSGEMTGHGSVVVGKTGGEKLNTLPNRLHTVGQRRAKWPHKLTFGWRILCLPLDSNNRLCRAKVFKKKGRSHDQWR